MSDLAYVKLDTVANGRAPRVFDYLFQKVLENIRDPNMKATAKRKITLEITFEPLASRNEAAVSVDGKVKLAEVETGGGHIFIKHRDDGHSIAKTHDTKQESLSLDAEAAASEG